MIASLVMTALNDHFLKQKFHNFTTGKISDFCGLFYFPFFLYAFYSFLREPANDQNQIRMHPFIAVLIVTDVLFILFKFTVLKDVLTENFPLQIINDPTDLWALLVNIPSYYFAKKYEPNRDVLN